MGLVKYLLIIQDDLNADTILYPFENSDSIAALTVQSKGISCIFCMKWLVVGEESYFRVNLVHNTTKSADVRNSFVTLYCPSTNFTVKRLCKALIRVRKAQMSHWNLLTMQWPSIIAAIQIKFNQFYLQVLEEATTKAFAVYWEKILETKLFCLLICQTSLVLS